MPVPTFILAGVEKSGSTSLYNYLSQHPDVFMSLKKEPDFFLRPDATSNTGEYEGFFKGMSGESAVGEASVGYFNEPVTAQRIQSVCPEVRVLLVLRDPIERAYSHYNMLVIHGVAPSPPYLNVLRKAQRTGDFRNTGIPTSRYANSLKAYQTTFLDRLYVYFYESFRHNPTGFVQEVYDDLGVNPEFRPDLSTTYNRSYRPRSGQLSAASFRDSHMKRVVRQLIPPKWRSTLKSAFETYNHKTVPPLDDETRHFAYELLREDIDRTEVLLQRSLSAWKPT